MLGDTGSGKTALVRRFIRGSFSEELKPTSGAMPSKKTVEIDGVSVDLVIWDIAGHLLRLHSAFTSDTDGAVLVCDLTKSPSLDILKKWQDMLVRKAGDVPMVVAANKADLADTKKCEGLENSGFIIIPTSARTGKNVEKLFMELAGMMRDKA